MDKYTDIWCHLFIENLRTHRRLQKLSSDSINGNRGHIPYTINKFNFCLN